MQRALFACDWIPDIAHGAVNCSGNIRGTRYMAKSTFNKNMYSSGTIAILIHAFNDLGFVNRTDIKK